MIRDGRVIVVDPGFVQVRPSPWRQAVDLANMMLVLGYAQTLDWCTSVRCASSPSPRSARRSQRHAGSPCPTQLRRMIRQQGRDLHAAFVRLLPSKPKPIPIQRWNRRRVLLLAAAAAVRAPHRQPRVLR